MFAGQDIGIDLGTASVIIHVKGKGIVLKEPSVVAIERGSGKVLAVGSDARRMIGRTPEHISAIRPLKDGVISDYDITEKMLRHFLRSVTGKHFLFKPKVVVCVPSGVTEVEKRSVIDATIDAGARYTQLISEPIAAAIGAGLDIGRPHGTMVVDIGGGTCDIAVISMGTSVLSNSIKIAGDAFDEAIIRYMRKRHNLLIGERTAEDMKIILGGAIPRPETISLDVAGRNLVSGLPKTVKVSSEEMNEALEEPLFAIIEAIHSVLEQTPPELASDIYEIGVTLTGGGALLYGMDALISERIKIPCVVADDPITCVARGTGIALENMSLLGSVLFEQRRGGNYMNV